MKFAWIQTEKASYPLTKLCRWLGVTPSGFYAWRQRPESTHVREDRRLKVLVQASFSESKQRYGSPRIHADLIEQDEQVSRKRVIRLMQEDGLKARTRKRVHVDHDERSQPAGGRELPRPAVRSRRTESALGRGHDRVCHRLERQALGSRSRRVRTIRSFAPGITRDNSGIRGMPTLASGLRISSQLGPVETIPQTHRGPHGLSMTRSVKRAIVGMSGDPSNILLMFVYRRARRVRWRLPPPPPSRPRARTPGSCRGSPRVFPGISGDFGGHGHGARGGETRPGRGGGRCAGDRLASPFPWSGLCVA